MECKLCTACRTTSSADINQYPVITAHVPSSERWLHSDPGIITTSTNRNLLEPTKVKKARRSSSMQKGSSKGKHRTSSGSSGETSNSRSFRAPVVGELIREESSSSKSVKSGRSQLVDMVVEDTQAEEVERVRARKEGGAVWNEDEAKHFVRTYDDEDEGEIIRHGFQPETAVADASDFAMGDDEEEQGNDREDQGNAQYDSLDDRHVWNAKDDNGP